MRFLSYFLVLITLSGCFSKTYPKVVGADNQTEIMIRSDFELMKTIFEIFPKEDRLPLTPLKKIEVNQFTTQSAVYKEKNKHSKITAYHIETLPIRGIWLHELLHYFSYHVRGDSEKEFPNEVLENFVNGTTASDFKKYFFRRERK